MAQPFLRRDSRFCNPISLGFLIIFFVFKSFLGGWSFFSSKVRFVILKFTHHFLSMYYPERGGGGDKNENYHRYRYDVRWIENKSCKCICIVGLFGFSRKV